jgi:hypothetical protein
MAIFDTARRSRMALDVSAALASRWAWCLVAILFIAFRDLAGGFQTLQTSLGDPDDALRLHEVKTLMAPASWFGAWFDMTLPRIGGAHPLVSHWSRLIDVPLVILLQGFGLVMPPEAAELATRIVWPLLVLFVFLRLLVRAVEAQGAEAGGWLMLVMALTCLTGLFQFRIGRIDHHNAMIAGAVAGLLILLEARRRAEAGTLAGVLIGLGLSVGYEPLAIVLPALAVLAVWSMFDLAWLSGVRLMAVAFTVTTAAVFALTVAPWQWLQVRCDALALNMVLLAAGGAAGLWIVDTRGRGWSVGLRLAALAGAGAVGLACYGALDTRCLAGPFGQVAPEIGPMWLDHVSETLSLFTYFKIAPPSIVAGFGLLALGIWCAIERWRRTRSPETLALLGLMLIAAPAGVWMLKLTPYASWLAAFAVTLSIADIGPTLQLTALSRQLGAALLASQWTFSALAEPVLALGQASSGAPASIVTVGDGDCTGTPAIRALAKLPKGLFVASIDHGSYVVALTQHDVLAAPYHRADRAMIENQAVLTAEPAAARRRLNELGADYVMLCMLKPGDKPVAIGGVMPVFPNGIEARLRAGESFEFLEPVDVSGPVAELKVWRVRR